MRMRAILAGLATCVALAGPVLGQSSAGSSGGGGSSAANPYPGSDYATALRQDAQTSALGAVGDAAYGGTGNAGAVALGKGQYAILANLYAAMGAASDAASATVGANGTQIAVLKALRDKLSGTLSVSGTVTANLGTLNGAATAANQASEIASLQAVAQRAAMFNETAGSSIAASGGFSGAIRDLGVAPAYSRVNAIAFSSAQAVTLTLQACFDSACSSNVVAATASVASGTANSISAVAITRYYRTVVTNTSASAATTVIAQTSFTAN